MRIINSFAGDFKFLSNFSPHSFVDKNGLFWKTSEHFYQAAKTDNLRQKFVISECNTPRRAKKIGQIVEMKKNWNDIKVSVMWNAIKMKFNQNPEIKKYLKSTFDFKLVEGNYWHDNFWGNCFCDKCKNKEGKNYLGVLLMMLRDEYLE